MTTSRMGPARTVGGPTFSELFTPKLVTVLREGYSFAHFRSDALAGLTVAIVALPLSMAIAIASGGTPAQGLYTSIFGGLVVSLLGGSRFQIGGPAGAFIVLVAGTVQQHGMQGLLLATILAGLMLVAIGLFRLGTYIKFIPYPVTVGFTSGIALIIFSSQIKDLLGLSLAGPEPGPLLEKLPVLWSALPSVNISALLVSAVTVVSIVAVRRLRPQWPAMLIGVAAASVVTAAFGLPVATIGTQFGGISSHLPMPALPEFSIEKVVAILPNAVAFALLGSIESLLSAVVADGMTGRRHRSNCELVAQGVANIVSAIFQGICVTGTIARTATNVRAGAHGPIAGIMHSAFLLVFVLVAAPLASYIPLAALAGVLAVVCWNMVERHAFAMLLRASAGDALVLLATFGLTVFRDLTEAIVVGFALGSVLFIHRMSRTTAIEVDLPLVPEDRSDTGNSGRQSYEEGAASDHDVVVYRISGAFFFGAAASIGTVLDRISDSHRALIIDFSSVPFVDSTAANTIEGLAHKAGRRSVGVVLTGTTHAIRRDLLAFGIKPPLVSFADSIESARAKVRRKLKNRA
ncbi:MULTISPECIES: SulP family inorganic anion transporter [unclassified Mesorhizobium]|uniref:SulP family inorganic anion transporter n=2 Tax=unclassified Mesorhizobium TaxID=325217 RepID=UPI00191070D3|nr:MULTISPECIES: SulP family inorganic anion transporter [unclassified Mesorhizobium]